MKTVQTIAMVNSETRRGNYAGLLQILRFNYPMFLAAALFAAGGVSSLLLVPFPGALQGLFLAGLILGSWWALATLAVSHWVYDRSGMFEFAWLRPFVRGMRTWANVHAGFDQTTVLLRRAFPGVRGTPVDIFDPAVMTEKSIHRARDSCAAVNGTVAGSWDHIPFPNASMDVVLFLFAAHELRQREQRAALFAEAARALRAGGVIVVVEHMRNLLNFCVFGPGVFHFHSRNEWLRAARGIGLEPAGEFALTPFARGFIWRKSP